MGSCLPSGMGSTTPLVALFWIAAKLEEWQISKSHMDHQWGGWIFETNMKHNPDVRDSISSLSYYHLLLRWECRKSLTCAHRHVFPNCLRWIWRNLIYTLKMVCHAHHSPQNYVTATTVRPRLLSLGFVFVFGMVTIRDIETSTSGYYWYSEWFRMSVYCVP